MKIPEIRHLWMLELDIFWHRCQICVLACILSSYKKGKKSQTTPRITTISIMTLSIKGLHVTLSISDPEPNNALPLC
jgi:hypothetical protein